MLSGTLGDWDNTNWEHMGSSVASIKFVSTDISFSPTVTPDAYKWNKNSADFSAILLRKPAFICIHAKELLS